MAQETASEPTTQYVGAFCRDHLLAGTLLLFLSGLASAITIILIHDGRGLVIPIALMSGVLLLGLEHLEGKRSVAPMRGRYGYLASALLIAAVTLVIYLPTLHIYFLAMTSAICTPSISRRLTSY